jgi:hypothetical protein
VGSGEASGRATAGATLRPAAAPLPRWPSSSSAPARPRRRTGGRRRRAGCGERGGRWHGALRAPAALAGAHIRARAPRRAGAASRPRPAACARAADAFPSTRSRPAPAPPSMGPFVGLARACALGRGVWGLREAAPRARRRPPAPTLPRPHPSSPRPRRRARARGRIDRLDDGRVGSRRRAARRRAPRRAPHDARRRSPRPLPPPQIVGLGVDRHLERHGAGTRGAKVGGRRRRGLDPQP